MDLGFDVILQGAVVNLVTREIQHPREIPFSVGDYVLNQTRLGHYNPDYVYSNHNATEVPSDWDLIGNKIIADEKEEQDELISTGQLVDDTDKSWYDWLTSRMDNA